MAPSPPLAGWRVGSPRPASLLLPRQGDEVIAPPRGTRSRCSARSVPAPLPRRPPPPALPRPRPPVPTMTERCSLWSALSAAACCFYRGSFVQVQVRGRLGSRQALRAGTPGRSVPGPGAGSRSPVTPRRVWLGRGCGLREGAGSPQPHLWAPDAPRGEGPAATPGTRGCGGCRPGPVLSRRELSWGFGYREMRSPASRQSSSEHSGSCG